MEINKQIKDLLTEAIKARTKESFEVAIHNMKHFISSEGEKRGHYITTITVEDKEFKIYMI